MKCIVNTKRAGLFLERPEAVLAGATPAGTSSLSCGVPADRPRPRFVLVPRMYLAKVRMPCLWIVEAQESNAGTCSSP